MPEVTVVGFRVEGEMSAVCTEWSSSQGSQLDHVVDRDGRQIGLAGFHQNLEEE